MTKTSAQILEEAQAKADAELAAASRDLVILTCRDAGMTAAAAAEYWRANNAKIGMTATGGPTWPSDDGPQSLFDHLTLNVRKEMPFYFALPKEVAAQRATENDAMIRAALYSPDRQGDLIKKIGIEKTTEALAVEGLKLGHTLPKGTQPPSGRKYNGEAFTPAALPNANTNGSADTGGVDKRSKANPWNEANIDPKLGRYSDVSMAKRASIIKNLGMKVATELAAAAGKQVQDMR